MYLADQDPATIWLTGLSGSGKSTLAVELRDRLAGSGRPCVVLDGDELRLGLNRDLGYSPRDRRENIRRAAEIARLVNDAGFYVVAAFISPCRDDRETARITIGEARFIETFLDAPLATCEKRDPKGLYVRARSGLISDFTGISAPYESPQDPALRLDTSAHSVDECVARVLAHLAGRSA